MIEFNYQAIGDLAIVVAFLLLILVAVYQFV
jgi:hypothetical protein